MDMNMDMDIYINESMGAYIYQPTGGRDIVLFTYVKVSPSVLKKQLLNSYHSTKVLSTYLCTTYYDNDTFLDQLNFDEVKEKILANHMIDLINSSFRELNARNPSLTTDIYTNLYSVSMVKFNVINEPAVTSESYMNCCFPCINCDQ